MEDLNILLTDLLFTGYFIVHNGAKVRYALSRFPKKIFAALCAFSASSAVKCLCVNLHLNLVLKPEIHFHSLALAV